MAVNQYKPDAETVIVFVVSPVFHRTFETLLPALKSTVVPSQFGDWISISGFTGEASEQLLRWKATNVSFAATV